MGSAGLKRRVFGLQTSLQTRSGLSTAFLEGRYLGVASRLRFELLSSRGGYRLCCVPLPLSQNRLRSHYRETAAPTRGYAAAGPNGPPWDGLCCSRAERASMGWAMLQPGRTGLHGMGYAAAGPNGPTDLLGAMLQQGRGAAPGGRGSAP
jgi:hypothetical protein